MITQRSQNYIHQIIFKITLIIMGLSTITTSVTAAENERESTKQGAGNTIQTIVLGSGCFWGAEKGYKSLEGTIDATSGYADGRGVEANYHAITEHRNKVNPDNFAEVVKVTYDSSKISLEKLLKYFFESHDPTQRYRQGNDVGTQYRSTILYQDADEKALAEKIRDEYQVLLTNAGYGTITTKIAPLEKFFPAEEYHQNYLHKNPHGYCPNHCTGVTFPPVDRRSADNSSLLSGKHIVMIEAPDCSDCQIFKQQIGNGYRGEIPLHYRLLTEKDGLPFKASTASAPTIYFIEDGKEVIQHKGKITREEFYLTLGAFIFGKESLAYKIAFEDGTERRFCRKYDLFKETGDGVFVDALSGEVLFDTKDRFNSGSGWLSFTAALPNSITEKVDNSFGMRRIEVRAKESNIHLGHVFEDGPNGARRFCINANILKFLPRDK